MRFLPLGAPCRGVALRAQNHALHGRVAPRQGFEGLLVQVHNLGNQPHDEAAQLVCPETGEDRVSNQVKGLEGAVVGRQLAEGLGARDLVVAQVQPGR